jgi:hypothetical protein
MGRLGLDQRAVRAAPGWKAQLGEVVLPAAHRTYVIRAWFLIENYVTAAWARVNRCWHAPDRVTATTDSAISAAVQDARRRMRHASRSGILVGEGVRRGASAVLLKPPDEAGFPANALSCHATCSCLADDAAYVPCAAVHRAVVPHLLRPGLRVPSADGTAHSVRHAGRGGLSRTWGHDRAHLFFARAR